VQFTSTSTAMENPHAERQAVLLERILKNTSKCTETILELNHCLEEIMRENSQVKIAADLATKYRKNVQYNLEATRGNGAEDKTQ
ncbi:DASH complex subunit Dad4-domain-containing protein, partial [Mycena vulgaris]